MSKTGLLITLLLLLAASLVEVTSGQGFGDSTRGTSTAGGPGAALDVGGDWAEANRSRWLWYLPQQWQFPGFLRPPVAMSLDTFGPLPETWPPAQSLEQAPQASWRGSDLSRTSRAERETPQAYRWNEATGRAEPVELQRWVGSRLKETAAGMGYED